MLQVIQIRSI